MIDEARRQVCVSLAFLLLSDGLEELLVYPLLLPEHGCEANVLTRAAVRRGLGMIIGEGKAPADRLATALDGKTLRLSGF